MSYEWVVSSLIPIRSVCGMSYERHSDSSGGDLGGGPMARLTAQVCLKLVARSLGAESRLPSAMRMVLVRSLPVLSPRLRRLCSHHSGNMPNPCQIPRTAAFPVVMNGHELRFDDFAGDRCRASSRSQQHCRSGVVLGVECGPRVSTSFCYNRRCSIAQLCSALGNSLEYELSRFDERENRNEALQW